MQSKKVCKKIKLAIIVSHPTQYHFKLYQLLDKEELVDLEVIYLFDTSRGAKDPDMGLIKWDLPLLEGYGYKFLPNWGRNESGGFFSRMNPSLIYELKNNFYDVVIINGYNYFSFLLSLIVAKLLGIKIIWRGESILRKGDAQGSRIKQIIKKMYLGFWFKLCDAIMYSCSGNKEFLTHYGVSEKRLFPISCAVNNIFFQSEHEKYKNSTYDIRNNLSIPKDNFIILFVSRFTKRKRGQDLLMAVNNLYSNGVKNISVVFVGDGPKSSDMKEFCQRKGISAHFTGFLNQREISKYYSIGDLYVMLSSYDPSPKSMNEAMNFSLPIICTNAIGTAYDLIEENENGFIVDVGDIKTIEKYICFLNTNRDRARKMGKRSLEIIQEWTYTKNVEQINKAIDFAIKIK